MCLLLAIRCFCVVVWSAVDFVSEMNFEKAEELCKSVDIFMSAGNHEFSHYLGEAKEDAQYRNISLPRVQRIFKNDIRCSSRIISSPILQFH